MLLKSIKLAGFKSFADPITIPVRSKLCGIVGPNGCGKSNVIDAVRWVIGESSAKQLRGKSMADVIFNGSHQRKPMARALVELQFDNQDGRLGGQFAQYSELSIRREVERNGQSSYFINNTPCRRRDVLDIFLGTGLGPRSYAIIEQGMVSRLIEAKPDELRVFIEEAAGVSKYKERRRETENRIKHTRENLDRVDDLLQELQRQQDHLQRQATAAENYRELNTDWSLKQAQLKAMQWQSFATKTGNFEAQHLELLTQSESIKAKISHADTALERLQQNQQEEQQQHNQIQSQYYATGSEVARVEQSLQHRREQITQWQHDLDINIERIDAAKQQVELYQDQIFELDNEVATLSPQKPMLEAAYEQAVTMHEQAEQAWQTWSQSWDDNQKQLSHYNQLHTVNQTKIDYSQEQIERLQQQIGHWQQEYQAADPQAELEDQLVCQQQKANNCSEQCVQLQDRVDSNQQQIEAARRQDNQLQEAQQQLQLQLQSAQGRYSSLNALQEAALGRDQEPMQAWLQQNQLADLPRLAEKITVDADWEHALESVLGNYLQAICYQGSVDYPQLLMSAQLPKDSQITFLNGSQRQTDLEATIPLPTLASKVDAAWPLGHLLSHIYTAEDKSQALQYCAQLASYESIVTAQGDWFGATWGRLGQTSDPQQGRISRQLALSTLQQKIASDESELAQLQQSIDHNHEQLQGCENQRQLLNNQLSQARDQFHRANGQVTVLQAQQEELVRNKARAEQQINDCQNELKQQQSILTAAQEATVEAAESLTAAKHKQDHLSDERDAKREMVRQSQAQAQLSKQKVDEFDIRLVASQDQLTILKQSQGRDQTHLSELQQTYDQLITQLENTDDTDDTLESQLESLLEQRLQQEQQLQQATTQLSESQAQRDELLASRKGAANSVEELQLKLVESQLEHKEIAIRQQTLQEQLQADGYHDIEKLLSELPEEATEFSWKQVVSKLKQKIDRLGPINLAAIDELAQINERYQHLESQHSDLIEALEILETAMAKIDEETQQKFVSTFDAINVNLKQLFPTIFDGGQAYLELIDREDLNSGVLIRAQPPGKRTATIQMLSGGEKALVAIALVFAMFQLNPAPFCILDEVDAPLDDVNVGRYCDLIKKMADSTQYLVITHSKITMSAVSQLMGITMQEAGVSRMVAVDIDEAMLLTET